MGMTQKAVKMTVVGNIENQGCITPEKIYRQQYLTLTNKCSMTTIDIDLL